jgi:hypothetical protein
MNTLLESARRIPVCHEADCCVIGGSCTGVFAAVRAARLGARVAIVENNGFFGGVATAGLVHIWHSLHDMARKQQIVAGLTQEILDRLAARDALIVRNPPTQHEAFLLNTEELKIELDRLVSEHQIRPFLHCRFASPVMEGGRMTAAIVEDKSGRRAITARYFIDATGDGDVVARMGLPCTTRPDLQPPTTVAVLENYAAMKQQAPDFRMADAVFDPKYPEALPRTFLWAAALPGRPSAFMVAGTRASGADCSNADSLTQAEIECRRQVRRIMDLLRNNIPGGKGVVLSALSPVIGIRETRHPQCLYSLTESDVLEGKPFPDAIAYGTYGCDIHHSDSPGITMRYLDGREVYNEPGQPAVWRRWRDEASGVTPFYQIPYRCLVPGADTNVLVAGRLMDADRGAYGAIRVMVNCNQTGEAAGVACALALESNTPVGQLDPAQLRRRLADGGSFVN